MEMVSISERSKGEPERLLYSIPDTAYVLGRCSHNHVRDLIKEKALEKVMIGRRVMVTSASIKRLIENGGTSSESQAA
jgi:hypothetical protein